MLLNDKLLIETLTSVFAALPSEIETNLNKLYTLLPLNSETKNGVLGALYWNSVDNAMYAWDATGSAWGSISSTAATRVPITMSFPVGLRRERTSWVSHLICRSKSFALLKVTASSIKNMTRYIYLLLAILAAAPRYGLSQCTDSSTLAASNYYLIKGAEARENLALCREYRKIDSAVIETQGRNCPERRSCENDR